ncbi:hypothetical protein C7M61_004483 [Candidozyma pseudohaemuli]|uniref:DNA-binding protein RAP1 n=1 Tax=Candidozyma pseudohaemuli TaxID=418784 RepID=A0A2P7YHM1_9ASCO|nr:hypothetical protein C7M61_004483 [[Candida] pseudohaemulonii]PSK35447.1 hypothetical protein C7M61_004483 [[Candida] pseudohaemulonii]
MSDMIVPNLLTDESGSPMAFYIHAQDPLREKYLKIIRDNGGYIEPSEVNADKNQYVQLSSYPVPRRTTFSFQFIDDYLDKGGSVYLEPYQLNPVKRSADELDEQDVRTAKAMAQAMNKKAKGPPKSTTKFTVEADNYILEQVRLKPRFRTSHKFFEELAQHDLLKGHTGNSVRSRYRAHLEHKLLYVYKTDDYDRLILDASGNRIALPVAHAKTIKNRFTADDDYTLCESIINHVLNTQDRETLQTADDKLTRLPDGVLNEANFLVSISFFDEFARQNTGHSSLSWRDRYRKFARVYGLQRYRDDYRKAMGTKEGPQPMKNLTSRESKSEKKAQITAKKLKANQVRMDMSAHDQALLADELARNHHSQLHHNHHLTHQLDSAGVAAVANMAVGQGALDEEIGEVKNSNIDDALRQVGVGAGRVQIEDDLVNPDVRALGIHQTDHSAIHPNLGGASVDGHDFEGLELKVDADSQDPWAKYMVYLPRDVLLTALFSDKFIQFEPNVIDRARELLTTLEPDDVGVLFDEFEKLGFTRAFVGHILKVTSSSVRYINDYLYTLRDALHDDRIDLVEVLFPRGHNGLWTPEQDFDLKEGNMQKLGFHDSESIGARRQFLGL